MIWRWVIFFNLLSVSACCAGTVKGAVQIVTEGHGKGRHGDLSGTVIWLNPLVGATAGAKRTGRPEMVQKDKTFAPHVLAVPVGARVDFPNFDPIFHNAFSNYNGEIFDVGLYPPGSNRSVRFTREGVVRVFCNIHATMSAVIVVLRTPYFATSASDGTFAIAGVPEGGYELHVYHERATEHTLAALVRTVQVAANTLDIGPISISENGYLSIPHLNKYGKPYGSAADATTYPGARQ